MLRGVFGAVTSFGRESSWGVGFGGAWHTTLAEKTGYRQCSDLCKRRRDELEAAMSAAEGRPVSD